MYHADLVIRLNTASTTIQKAEILREIRAQSIFEEDRNSFVRCVLPDHCSNILQLLKGFLQFPEDPLIETACGCLWMLSRSTECQQLMMDPQLGLASLMLRTLQNSNATSSNDIFLAICNCCLHPDVHKYLLSDELGYLAYFHELLDDQYDVCPYKFFSTLVTDMKDSNLDSLVGYDIVNLIVRRLLLSSNNPNLWDSRFDGIEDHCLSFITSISTLPKGSQHLSQYPEMVGFLASMLEEDNMEGLRPLVILANVFGDNPLYKEKINLRKNIHLLSLLKLIFDLYKRPSDIDLCNMLSDEYGFVAGMLTVRDLTTAVSHLCLSTDNCWLFCEGDPSLLSYLTFIFYRIVDNSRSITTFDAVAPHAVGGGGDDEESLISLLRSFICMTSHSEDEMIKRALTEKNDLGRFLACLDVLIRKEETERKRWMNFDMIQQLAQRISQLLD